MSVIRKLNQFDPATKAAKVAGRGLTKATGVTGFQEVGDHASAAASDPVGQAGRDWKKMTGKGPVDDEPRAVRRPSYTGWMG